MFYDRHEVDSDVWWYVNRYQAIIQAKDSLERDRKSIEEAIRELEPYWKKIAAGDRVVLQPPSSLATPEVQSLKPDGGSSYPPQAGG